MRQVFVEVVSKTWNCVTRVRHLGLPPAASRLRMSAERARAASDSDCGPAGDAAEGATPSREGQQHQRSGRPRRLALPRVVTDALVMLRIERDQQFLDSAAGRHRRTVGEIWDGIAAELNARFAEVRGLPLTGRAAAKKWSYIETLAKVRIASRCSLSQVPLMRGGTCSGTLTPCCPAEALGRHYRAAFDLALCLTQFSSTAHLGGPTRDCQHSGHQVAGLRRPSLFLLAHPPAPARRQRLLSHSGRTQSP